MLIRHEINLLNGTHAIVGNTSNRQASEQFMFDFSIYNGTLTVYLEVVYSSNGTGSITLGTASSAGAYITASNTSGVLTLARSSNIRDSIAEWSGVTVALGTMSASTVTITVKAARLIIIQDTSTSALTATQAQFEIGNRETGKVNTTTHAALTNPKYWRYEADKWDGTKTFEAELVWNTVGTNTVNARLEESTNGGSSWAAKVTIVNNATGTAVRRTRATFTPTDGALYRIASFGSSSMNAYAIYAAKIVATQTGTDITKMQEHYLLANTLLAAGTAAQKFLTKWDPSEWDGVTNTYRHAIAAGGTGSTVELETAAGTQLSGSSIASALPQAISGSVTMPASATDLDVQATTNAGNVSASRLIVDIVKYTAPPTGGFAYAYCMII